MYSLQQGMDIEFYNRILSIDSTSGRETELSDVLAAEFAGPGRRVTRYEVSDGSTNLLVIWGTPKIIFCTHLDTVPPYISPKYLISEGSAESEDFNPKHAQDYKSVTGRGTADAKGQIFAMWEACKTLEAEGFSDFGLLLLSGEETGSKGAKAFNDQHPGAEWLVVGEPTDNHIVSAAKGTKSFEVVFEGIPFHSGYPQYGCSAVEMFNDFMNALRSVSFPVDTLLGETTFNIGQVRSDNPQNILSDKLTCRVYFRTTFESDKMVSDLMRNMAGPQSKLRFGRPRSQDGSDLVAKEVAAWQKAMSVTAFGGDAPTKFEVFEGFDVKPVAFGSDAPQLRNFTHKVLYGPGSILTAHRPDEQIALADIAQASADYVNIYKNIMLEKTVG